MSSISKARSRGGRQSRTRAVVAALVVGIAACGHVSAGAVQDVVFASSFEDGEGGSTGGWQVLEWPQPVSYEASCALVRVYGIVQGDEFQFTTCVPPDYAGPVGTGDPKIVSVIDSEMVDYIAANDDCPAEFIPQLAGWSCLNTDGEEWMPCAPPGADGVIVESGATYVDVTICPLDLDAGVGLGIAPFHVLWKGSSTPSPDPG